MGIQILKACLHFSFGMKGGEMETIDVSLHVGVPIEKAWELLANYEGYTFAEEITSVRLLHEGRDEKYGVGAIRAVQIVGVTLIEEIVTFDSPGCIEYRITESPIPTRHEIGGIYITSTDDGCEVRWTSRFENPTVEARSKQCAKRLAKRSCPFWNRRKRNWRLETVLYNTS